MPQGLLLNSAATLSDPDGAFGLRQYCAQQRLPYPAHGQPVPLELFNDYGMAFQQRFAPHLETTTVSSLTWRDNQYEIGLTKGDFFYTKKVIVAVGVEHFRVLPRVLTTLPFDRYSHSTDHRHFDRYRDKDVVVIGGGASAVDVALALQAAKARVELVARNSTLRTGADPVHRRTLLTPWTCFGPGWKRLACEKAPGLFHRLSAPRRLRLLEELLVPEVEWFNRAHLREVPFHGGYELFQAELDGERVQLRFDAPDRPDLVLTADHVIAATGLRPALRRLRFLTIDMFPKIDTVDLAPALNEHFESSIPGLYFVGPIASESFGPLMRFACGAGFAARRIVRHLRADQGKPA